MMRYSLEEPPSLDSPGFIIDQCFLRHYKAGEIPDLEKYLDQLNHFDWTGLLANNPCEEFIKNLHDEMIPQLNWKYILGVILNYQECYL